MHPLRRTVGGCLEFRAYLFHRRGQEAATGLRLPPPVALDAHVIYLKCPRCANVMNRMNYAGRSGIVINVCTPHGIWLDRDEIRQIIEYIRSGGLDHARKAEIEELRDAHRATGGIESIAYAIKHEAIF